MSCNCEGMCPSCQPCGNPGQKTYYVSPGPKPPSCDDCCGCECKPQSLFGVNCECIRPLPPPIEPPEPKVCPYLVCPCPEKCIVEEMNDCVEPPPKCGRVDCHALVTGYDLTCNPCRKNCPVETYCPVPKSCLPRCTPNSPFRFPHYSQYHSHSFNTLKILLFIIKLLIFFLDWKLINTRNFHAL